MRLKLIRWLLKPVIKNLREKGNTGKYKELSDKLFEISKGLTHRIVSEYNSDEELESSVWFKARVAMIKDEVKKELEAKLMKELPKETSLCSIHREPTNACPICSRSIQTNIGIKMCKEIINQVLKEK